MQTVSHVWLWVLVNMTGKQPCTPCNPNRAPYQFPLPNHRHVTCDFKSRGPLPASRSASLLNARFWQPMQYHQVLMLQPLKSQSAGDLPFASKCVTVRSPSSPVSLPPKVPTTTSSAKSSTSCLAAAENESNSSSLGNSSHVACGSTIAAVPARASNRKVMDYRMQRPVNAALWVRRHVRWLLAGQPLQVLLNIVVLLKYHILVDGKQ